MLAHIEEGDFMKKLFLLFCFICFFITNHVFAEESSEKSRYIVLILDTSGSMDGIPIEKEKESVIKFCNDVVHDKTSKNYVSVVGMGYWSTLITDFTDDFDLIKENVNSINAIGGTNYSSAFQKANNQLSKISDKESEKSIVLFSDGLPETGNQSKNGPYQKEDSAYYLYANYMINYVKQLSDTNIYTLGFFDKVEEKNKSFANRFLLDLASDTMKYYEVNNVDDISFQFGNVAKDIVDKPKSFSNYFRGITPYDDNGERKDNTISYIYDDQYFLNSAYDYNPSLAALSMSFASSAFASYDLPNIKGSNEKDYEKNSKNAFSFLENCGFTNIIKNTENTKTPTTDSIGVIIGSKEIEKNNESARLIAIGIRGAGYGNEWGGNFTLGSSGNHLGFERARDIVLETLKNYISDNQITGNCKFWITGFSRAAAVSNLVSGYLDENNVLNVNYTPEDVYAYTFETPAGYFGNDCKDSRFNNIFNIINLNDIVPKVAPATYGFSRYGIDKYILARSTYSRYNDFIQKVINNYEDIFYKYVNNDRLKIKLNSGYSYRIDKFKYSLLPLSVVKSIFTGNYKNVLDDINVYAKKSNYDLAKLLNDLMIFLSKNIIKSRENYVMTLQNHLRYIAGYNKSKTLSEEEIKNDFYLDKYLSAIFNSKFPNDDEKNSYIDDYFRYSIWRELLYITFADLKNYNLQDVINASINYDLIMQAHYPELCLAWLRLADPNFNGGQEINIFNNGGYRFIHINCPVDVHVYDENHTLVASIENEQPKEISSLVSGIDADGQKYVILPNTDDYTIEIKAREDTKMNYGVDEYSALAGEYTRFVNYFDVDMKKDEVITAFVPKQSQEELDSSIPDGSNQVYILSQNGNNLQATSDLKGDAAKNAYYDVEVISEDENKGMTSGNVFKAYGQFAEIQAEAKEGYEFIGWFVDNQKVSDQNIYRIRVEKPLKYVAKFEKKKDDATSSSNQSSKTTDSTNDTTQSSNFIEKQVNQKVNKKKSMFMNAGMKFMSYVAIGLGLIIVSVFLIHFNRKRK